MAVSNDHTYALTFSCDEAGQIAIWVDGDEIVNDLEAGLPVATKVVNFEFRFPARSHPETVQADAPTAT